MKQSTPIMPVDPNDPEAGLRPMTAEGVCKTNNQ